MPKPSAAASFQNAGAHEQAIGQWSRSTRCPIIRFGGLSDGDRVLDVGCGTGSLTLTLPGIANVAGVTGTELNEAYAGFARSWHTPFQPYAD